MMQLEYDSPHAGLGRRNSAASTLSGAWGVPRNTKRAWWRMPKVRKGSVSSKHNAGKSSAENRGFTRRSLLKNTAGAIIGGAVASVTGVLEARAQVGGLYT